MRLLTCQFTDPGGRSPNEDSVGYFTTEGFSAWIAADGLGGHTQGEVASAEAVRSLETFMNRCKKMNSSIVENAFKQMNGDVLMPTTATHVFSLSAAGKSLTIQTITALLTCLIRPAASLMRKFPHIRRKTVCSIRWEMKMILPESFILLLT